MKRFALLFGSLVLSGMMIGCGDSGGGGDETSAVSAGDEPGEAKRDIEKRAANAEARAKNPPVKKKR